MACFWCDSQYKTLSEFFAQEGKSDEIKVNCTEQVPAMQKALAHLRPYIYMLPGFACSEKLPIGKSQIDTGARIYKTVAFYAKWCSDCVIDYDTCDSQSCCKEYCSGWYWEMIMDWVIWTSFLEWAQFLQPCIWGKKIYYSLPTGVTDAYVVYFRMFDTIVDENSKIQVPEYLYPALQMLIAYHSSNNGSYNAGDREGFAQDFINFMQQIYNVFRDEVAHKFTFKLTP